MEGVRPSQLYQGGSKVGVECACCGATATSGSWRRVWTLPNGRPLNGCNKCGQRWQKAGRPGSLAELLEAEALKAARNASAAAAAIATGSKRPSSALAASPAVGGALIGQHSPAAAAAAGAAKRMRPLAPPPPRVRRIFDDEEEEEEEGETFSPSSSTDTLTPTNNRSVTASFHSTPAAGRPPLPPRPPQGAQRTQQAQQSPAASAAAAAAVLGGGHRYVSFTVQKLTGTGKANHAVFWLQDEQGDSTLAVVGMDARMSGHFTYVTAPAFLERHPGVPPLRCTNRGEVQAWLAGFGCTTAVDTDSARLPDLSAEERRRLLNPEEPVWSKPSADALAGSWRGVREESGRLADGRHFKRFWLLPAGGRGQEKLVVTGVDSSRKDRRYKYFAEEEMGGFAFENVREVMAWCNHILSRPASALLEPEQVRLPRPLQEEELGSNILERLRALAQQERLPPLPPPPTSAPRASQQQQQQQERERLPGTPGGPAAAAAARAAAANAGAAAAAQHARSPYAASLSGKVRPMARLQLEERGSGRAVPEASATSAGTAPSSTAGTPSGGPRTGERFRPWQHQQLQQQQQGAPSAAVAAAASLPPPSPPVQNLKKLSLRCATCGLTTHPTDDCPLAICSPPSLIRPAAAPGAHRTISLLLPSDPALKPASPGGSAGEEGAWQLPPSPQMLDNETLRQQLLASHEATGGSGSGSLDTGGSKPISAGVQKRFSSYPALLNFVQALPSSQVLSHFSHYAERLTSHISDVPPPLPTSELDVPVGGWRWTPTMEALSILHELSACQVSLSLLESSGIAGAVAQLRTHRNVAISAAADSIVQRWRTAAVAALSRATGGREPR